MLSKKEKQQIQEEEVAAAQAVLVRRREQKRRGASWAYRREVRAALNPLARIWVAVLLTTVVLAGVLAAVLRPSGEAPAPDDTSGGVASTVLMSRCQEALRAQVGPGEMKFPDLQDAAGQITASPDGKRWDGSFTQEGAVQPTDFSCVFTVATGEIGTELITP